MSDQSQDFGLEMESGPYSITLDCADMYTIGYIGYRYNWSEWAYRNLHEGENRLAEHKAWAFKEAVEADMDGDYSPFPLLDSRSELYTKLCDLWESIV